MIKVRCYCCGGVVEIEDDPDVYYPDYIEFESICHTCNEKVVFTSYDDNIQYVF